MIWDPISSPVYYAKVTAHLPGGKRGAEVRTPGICEIEGNSGSPRKWDELTGYGLSGSTLRFTGLGLAKYDMIIQLFDKRDMAEWEAFLPIVKAPPKKQRPRALDVWHPKLAQYDIQASVILDMSFPKTDERGVTEIVIYWQAYRAVSFQLAKIEGGPPSPALDPYEQRIKERSERLEALARGG